MPSAFVWTLKTPAASTLPWLYLFVVPTFRLRPGAAGNALPLVGKLKSTMMLLMMLMMEVLVTMIKSIKKRKRRKMIKNALPRGRAMRPGCFAEVIRNTSNCKRRFLVQGAHVNVFCVHAFCVHVFCVPRLGRIQITFLLRS